MSLILARFRGAPRGAATIIAALFLFGVAPAAAVAQAPTLRIYHIDVGQGDATLIVGPTGKTCLVDAGDVGHGTGDVLPLLAQIGATQIDVSVATHWHSDHYGAFIELKNNGFWPLVAYDRGLDASLNGQFLYSNYVAAMGVRRATMNVGDVVDLGGGASLQCVCGNGTPLGGSAVPLGGTAQIENNRSLVVKVSFGNFQAVIGGDLEGGFNGTADVESAAAAAVGDVDLYKVHHHGSDTSTNSLWLATIRPEVSVVSCGDGNPYGHPHQNVVTALLAAPDTAMVYRLNTCDPSTLTPGNPEQQVVGGNLLVTTDGASYTITGPGVAPLVRNVDEGGPVANYAPLDLVISEFLPNPKGPSGLPIADADGEWVEIRNNLPTAVNLLGFTLRDGGLDAFLLPAITIAPFGYATVGRSANAALNGGLVFDYVAPANELVLANMTDEIELVAPNGVVLDAVVYGGTSGIPVPNGASLERINARAPALASNFAASTCCYWPAGAAPCVCSGSTTQHNYGTPRAVNAVDATPPYAFFSTSGPRTPGSQFALHLAVFGSAGKSYVMAASLATSPPFVLSDGRTIDMANDFLLVFSLTPGNGVFANMVGVMNGFGAGQGAVTLPPDPALSGLGFFAGGLVLDPAHATGIGSISDPLFVQIQ